MTGVELQSYLVDSGLFKDENVYMVENINGKIYNVPSYYKSVAIYKVPSIGRIEIKIYYNKYGDCTRYVDFTLAGVNLFGSYKLSELTLPLLCKELNKVFSEVIEFKHWMTKELRDYKIKVLTDEV